MRTEKIREFPTRVRDLLFTLLLALAVLSGCGGATASTPDLPAGPASSVYFSPNGGCETAILNEISGATTSIRVLAYEFTSVPIANAMEAKQASGVSVEVILDQGNAGDTYSQAQALKNSGVSVLIDVNHPVMHNKIIVVDGVTVITGSYNLTWSAEHQNAENIVIFRNDAVKGSAFSTEYLAIRANSVPY